MKVRLGFAVAAFLEPQILIVDEVLAVGDSSFQQKCLDRMRHVIQSGTTLLLVSHDLATVGATDEARDLARGRHRAGRRPGRRDPRRVPQGRSRATPRRTRTSRARSASTTSARRARRPDGHGRRGLHHPVLDRDRRGPFVRAVPRCERGRGHADLRGAPTASPQEGRPSSSSSHPHLPLPAGPVLLVVRRVREGDVQGAHGVAAGRARSSCPAGCACPACRRAIVRLSPST